MLVTSNPTPGEYYNIGGTYSCSVREMLNYLISISTHTDIKIEVDPERLRPIDADLQVPDTNKFKSHTGWEPQICFEQTMNDLLNYWREQIKTGKRFLSR
jgi:GDPmannose 4,6-dehydratase